MCDLNHENMCRNDYKAQINPCSWYVYDLSEESWSWRQRRRIIIPCLMRLNISLYIYCSSDARGTKNRDVSRVWFYFLRSNVEVCLFPLLRLTRLWDDISIDDIIGSCKLRFSDDQFSNNYDRRDSHSSWIHWYARVNIQTRYLKYSP